ncbi:hypothetical protein WA158_003527 [Blastocystis sp. Blastoise]
MVEESNTIVIEKISTVSTLYTNIENGKIFGHVDQVAELCANGLYYNEEQTIYSQNQLELSQYDNSFHIKNTKIDDKNNVYIQSIYMNKNDNNSVNKDINENVLTDYHHTILNISNDNNNIIPPSISKEIDIKVIEPPSYTLNTCHTISMGIEDNESHDIYKDTISYDKTLNSKKNEKEMINNEKLNENNENNNNNMILEDISFSEEDMESNDFIETESDDISIDYGISSENESSCYSMSDSEIEYTHSSISVTLPNSVFFQVENSSDNHDYSSDMDSSTNEDLNKTYFEKEKKFSESDMYTSSNSISSTNVELDSTCEYVCFYFLGGITTW